MARQRLIVLLAAFVILGLVIGCSQQPADRSPSSDIQTVKLYFADADNERLVTEEREITLKPGGDKYSIVLRELIRGPKNEKYRVNISPNTRIYGTIKQGTKLIVDVNKDFNKFGGSMAEILGIGAFVNTLTQFSEIDEVKILVEGEELIGPSGNPRGFMGTFPLQAENGGSTEPPQQNTNKNTVAPKTTQKNATLYFANQDASAVIAESRTITVPTGISNSDYVKAIVSELIKGPRETELKQTIPKEATLRSVQIKGTTAYLDFSREMHTKHWRGAAGESMTINSIVNTLTELDYITQVQITVEGQPLAIEHIVMNKPKARNEDMIGK
ncbi:MAG: GerMN domain-containing protein [Syntrophomonadaceae bacterium]|nr:GerMN domain-containing protein [Syntrophomonadaceae bacterium]